MMVEELMTISNTILPYYKVQLCEKAELMKTELKRRFKEEEDR